MSTIWALTGPATSAGANDEAARPALSAGLSSTALSPRYSWRWRTISAERIERGQDVDEAEELGLENRVLHRPLHQAGVGAFLGEQRGRRLLIHEREELLALGAESRLKLGIEHEKRGHENCSDKVLRVAGFRKERSGAKPKEIP